MRKSLGRSILVLTLLASACTGDAQPSTTTLSAQGSTSTTRPQIFDGGLLRVDPATLIPINTAPISVGQHFWGVVSENRRWAAVEKWVAATDSSTVEIINLDTDQIVASSASHTGAAGLAVTNEGTAYWIQGGTGMTLNELQAGSSDTVVAWDEFPEDYFSWDGFEILRDGRFGFVGTVLGGDASVFIVDIDTSETLQIEIPGVRSGIIDEIEVGADLPVLVHANPYAIWDEDNQRVLVVEAARDVVTEVGYAAPTEVTEHRWEPPGASRGGFLAWLIPPAHAKGLTTGTSRQAALSPTGDLLFVATSLSEIEESESGDITSVASPQLLVVLDTETWQAHSLEIHVDSLYESPNGAHLIAQGSQVTESVQLFEIRPSPVYVIDQSTLQVLIGFQADDSSRPGVDFSSHGSLMYLTTWTETSVKIDIIDIPTLTRTGSIEFRELSHIAGAGLLAFHVDN